VFHFLAIISFTAFLGGGFRYCRPGNTKGQSETVNRRRTDNTLQWRKQKTNNDNNKNTQKTKVVDYTMPRRGLSSQKLQEKNMKELLNRQIYKDTMGHWCLSKQHWIIYSSIPSPSQNVNHKHCFPYILLVRISNE
jgi:hypothetical protein